MRQKEYIASLLEKFLEGQSTEAEEQTLSEYFDSADDVPAEWVAYQELFRSFTTDAYDFGNEEIDAMLAPTPSRKGQLMVDDASYGFRHRHLLSIKSRVLLH